MSVCVGATENWTLGEGKRRYRYKTDEVQSEHMSCLCSEWPCEHMIWMCISQLRPPK